MIEITQIIRDDVGDTTWQLLTAGGSLSLLLTLPLGLMEQEGRRHRFRSNILETVSTVKKKPQQNEMA